MKRSEIILKMQRVHGIRYCMVEGNYITLEQFMEEMLSVLENEGMLPPRTKLSHLDAYDNAWDPETVSK